MSIFKRITFVLFIFMVATDAVAQLDQDFERILNAYIKEEGIILDEATLQKIVDSWPGIRTMDGVRSMVSEILKPTGGSRRSCTFSILKRSEVPREQIVSHLLERAESSRGDIDSFWRYFALLDRYPEDDRNLKFLSSLLDVKAIPKASYRKLGEIDESTGEQPWRISDAAHGTIIFILEKRGEIKPGDPGYGDPGGESSIKARDGNIAALKRMLIRSGYVAADVPPQSPAVAVTPKPLPSDRAAVEDSLARASTAANSGVASTPNQRNWPLWLGLVIVLVATAFAAFKWRAGK